MTYANMPHHIGVTQETIEITYPTDVTILIDATKAISEIIHDQIVSSRDTAHVSEAQVDSDTIQVTDLTVNVHRVVFSLETRAQDRIINALALINPYATSHART